LFSPGTDWVIPDSVELSPGVRVDQRYVLVELLGEGGQGEVWRTSDMLDGNAARAVKLVFLADASPTSVRRALGEAEAMERAAHPGLVPCRRFFRDSDAGILGLVFDFVSGRSLFDALSDPRMTRAHRYAVLGQVAETLAYVHAHGMVHRDLKSTNLLITHAFWADPYLAGGVKLVDFGIAAPTGNPRPVTVQGQVIGTPAYMAPELLSSRPRGENADGFARDMFAFGVLACEVLDGAHPTGLDWNAPARDFAAAYRTLAAEGGDWPPPGSAGRSLVIRACLALDSRGRPADGAALLQRLRSGAASTAAPRPGPSRAPMTTPHQYATDVPRSAGWPGAAAPPPSYVAARTRMGAPTSGITPATGAWIRALGLVLLGGIAAAGGAALFSTCSAGSPTMPVTVAVASAQPAPQTLPVPVEAPTIEAPLAAPCSTVVVACQSGRKCTPGLAPSHIPDRSWWLRVSGVAGRTPRGFGEDLGGTHPAATVCLRRAYPAGPEICVPFTRMVATGGDRDDRLQVTRADLERGNIAIRISEGGTDILSGTSAPTEGQLLTTALCGGTHLYIGDGASALAKVNLFLDER
jgi:serine/threonine-protein kinase